MHSQIRVGVLGPGRIFQNMAKAIEETDGLTVTAIASTSMQRAREGARLTGAEYAFDSYASLAASDAVDLCYIATLNNAHCGQAMLCMEHGKHVLCEKPMALNDREVREMAACARANGVFLMEAMWTRFVPLAVKLRELLDAGAIGKVRHVNSRVVFRAPNEPESRLRSRTIGGGAALDVGVYALSQALMVLGDAPKHISGEMTIGETGVDIEDSFLLTYDSGATAHVYSSMNTPFGGGFVILGEEGGIEIPGGFPTSEMILTREGAREVFSHPGGSPFAPQLAHVRDCIREGHMESPVMPLETSESIAKISTIIRRRAGVIYPEEC